MRNVLIIEDNMLINDKYKVGIDHFFELGVNVIQAYEAEEALRRISNFSISVIVLDVNLPDGWDGINLAEIIRKTHPFTPIIVATDKKGDKYRAEVQDRIKNIAFLTKPFRIEKLIAEIKHALDSLDYVEKGTNYLTVKVDGLSCAILANDIVKIEKVKDNKTYEILTYDEKSKRYDSVYFYAPTVESIFSKFDDPRDFIQCNRSCIINKNRRRKLDRKNKVIFLRPDDIAIDIGGKEFKDNIYALFE